MNNSGQVDIGIGCPRCGAFNAIDAVSCVRCRHLLSDGAASSDGKSTQHTQELLPEDDVREEALARVDEVLAYQKRKSERGFRVVLITAGVVFLAIVSLAAWHAYREQLRQQQLDKDYETALGYLEAGEFELARDGLVRLLAAEPHYPDATRNLSLARWGLAQEYIRVERWHDAQGELHVLLAAAPDDPDVRLLLGEAYEGLINQATDRGDYARALILRFERFFALGR